MENRMEGPLKKTKTELRYEPAILLLGIYPEKIKTLTRKDIYTPAFISSTIYNNRDT